MLRLRLCLWRRDRTGARELLRTSSESTIIAFHLFRDCAAAPVGALDPRELAARAARAVNQCMASKRKSFVHQLAAEGLAALAPAEALRHVVSAARLPIADLRLLDACPALSPLRRAPALSNFIVSRVSKAGTVPPCSSDSRSDTGWIMVSWKIVSAALERFTRLSWMVHGARDSSIATSSSGRDIGLRAPLVWATTGATSTSSAASALGGPCFTAGSAPARPTPARPDFTCLCAFR
jgi:hypothetical protein